MTWDWDKLQEKRQRQQGQRPSRPLFGDDDNDTQDEQPRRARRSPSGNGGDGNGFDGRNALKKLSGMKMPGGMVIWLVLGLVGLWLLSGIYIVNPDEEGVVLRFGKLARVVGPGLYLTIPLIEHGTIRVDQRTIATPFYAEKTLTADLVPLDVNAVLFWHVWDAKAACTEVGDFTRAVELAAQTALRDAIGRAGADFKREFTPESYRAFFERAGYRGAQYTLCRGRIPCAVAVLRKTEENT